MSNRNVTLGSEWVSDAGNRWRVVARAGDLYAVLRVNGTWDRDAPYWWDIGSFDNCERVA